jgi:hypothetical protein
MSKTSPKKKTSTRKTAVPSKKTKLAEAGLSPLIVRTIASAQKRNKQQGEDALRSIELNRRTIADAFYDIAISLNVLRKQEVYVALGCESFEELIPRTGLSRTICFQLLQLPQHLTRDTAISLGPEKSNSLIFYVKSTPEDDDAETLAREDALIGGKPISKCSAEDINEAARAAIPPEKRKAQPGEKEAHAARRAVETKLKKLGAGVEVKRVKGAWMAVVTMPIESALKLR